MLRCDHQVVAGLLLVLLMLLVGCGSRVDGVFGEYKLRPHEIVLHETQETTERRIVEAQLSIRPDGTFFIQDKITYTSNGRTTREKPCTWSGRWIREGSILRFPEAHSADGLPELEHHKVMGFEWVVMDNGDLRGRDLGGGLVYLRDRTQ